MASPRHNDAPTPVAPPRWSEYPPARDIDDRAKIMRRLAVSSVAELVCIAMRAGIVPTEAQWSALA